MFAAATTRHQFTTSTVAVKTPTTPARATRATGITAAAQTLEGVVVSQSGAKSKVVLVERKVPHPKYIKRVNASKKFMFHDENDGCKVGDRVEISACRPMSRKKRFQLNKVVYACKTDVDCPVA